LQKRQEQKREVRKVDRLVNAVSSSNKKDLREQTNSMRNSISQRGNLETGELHSTNLLINNHASRFTQNSTPQKHQPKAL